MKRLFGPLVVLVLILVGAGIIKMLLPKFQEHQMVESSDAAKMHGKIRGAVDSWIGYYPLRSKLLKSSIRKAGWNLIVKDDGVDLEGRMAKLKSGELDFAVATIDSDLLVGVNHGFPGSIVMVIDESHGGDAILARRDKFETLDDLKGKKGIRVAFLPDSPSHHLLKAVSNHFGVPELLRDAEQIKTNSTEETLKALIGGSADVGVLWEPDVSRALSDPDIIKLLGTEDTAKVVVDVLLFNREFAGENPEVVELFMTEYFKVLKKYRDDEELLAKHVQADTGIAEGKVKLMLAGVKWVNFDENCRDWFDLGDQGGYSIYDTIDATAALLVASGDFQNSPVPDEDPQRLTNSSFLEKMSKKGFGSAGPEVAVAVDSLEKPFAALSLNEWNKLLVKGTIPLVFQSGTTELNMLNKKAVEDAVEKLRHYPNYRIFIKGHTGTRGDKEMNVELSQARADGVQKYIEVIYGVDANRIMAKGYGGMKPLNRKPGQSKRSYERGLSRVEFVLVKDSF
jgi:outer membrane protein OmpA-like peptidoglycan-associated protein